MRGPERVSYAQGQRENAVLMSKADRGQKAERFSVQRMPQEEARVVAGLWRPVDGPEVCPLAWDVGCIGANGQQSL